MAGRRTSRGAGPEGSDQAIATERLYAAVVEFADDAIFTKTLGGTITSWNPGAERLYGYRPDEIIGRSVTILAPPELADEIPAFLERIAAGERIDHFETVRVRRDGARRDVSLTISPIRDERDRVVAASTIARDITARRAAENQLLQAQKLESIGRLAGGIAHDFNNMLFAIRGYTELLADDLAADQPTPDEIAVARRSVAAIGDAADRAAALTSQLLAFSRQQVVRPKVVSLADSVRALEPMLRPLIGEHRRLTTRLDPATGNLLADPGQLDQILVNLVVNARDAMPGDGTITIETGNAHFDEAYTMEEFDVAAGPYVFLAVSDTGVGMDRETRRHIFEPFFTTKPVGTGTGLGLATIYGIVRGAGGHIWLYSEPGIGSTFKLYFPRVDAPEDAAETATGEPGTIDRTVLVVEDEPAVRELTTRLLVRAGCTVHAVATGTEAIALIESGRIAFDVVVSDVIMPGMTGLELADRLIAAHPTLGFVLLSGYTQETFDVHDLVGRGAMFLSKPATTRQLVDAVSRAGALEPVAD